MDETDRTDNTEAVDTRAETLLVATEVLDEIGWRVSYIHRSLGPLRAAAPSAAAGAAPKTYVHNLELVERIEEQTGAILRLLETLGADLPYPSPPSQETIDWEKRMRSDPHLWNETMSRLKTALPYGITPEVGDPGE